MGKVAVKHAKGIIKDRFFIALTERVGSTTSYIALERTSTGWKRHNIGRNRLVSLYRALTVTAS
jgi:hypothetical protein